MAGEPIARRKIKGVCIEVFLEALGMRLIPLIGFCKKFLRSARAVSEIFTKGDGGLGQGEELFPFTPWLTGPLLAPTPFNALPDHPAIEPSITLFNFYGEYDSNWELKKKTDIWAINPIVDFQFGINDFLGIETIIGAITNFRGSRISTNFQDTIMYFGCQLLNDKKGTWIPDLRFIIQETYPTGNYQDLDPLNEEIDHNTIFAMNQMHLFP